MPHGRRRRHAQFVVQGSQTAEREQMHAAVVERAGEHVVRRDFGMKTAGHDMNVHRRRVVRQRQRRIEYERSFAGAVGRCLLDERGKLPLDRLADGVPEQFLGAPDQQAVAHVERGILHDRPHALDARRRCAVPLGMARRQHVAIVVAQLRIDLGHREFAQTRYERVARPLIMRLVDQHRVFQLGHGCSGPFRGYRGRAVIRSAGPPWLRGFAGRQVRAARA